MVIKVVPLPVQQGIKFDVILPDGYIVTIHMTEYEIRSYRGAIKDVIEAKVVDWLQSNDYSDEDVTLIFC